MRVSVRVRTRVRVWIPGYTHYTVRGVGIVVEAKVRSGLLRTSDTGRCPTMPYYAASITSQVLPYYIVCRTAFTYGLRPFSAPLSSPSSLFAPAAFSCMTLDVVIMV